jgi:hypothetical protein
MLLTAFNYIEIQARFEGSSGPVGADFVTAATRILRATAAAVTDNETFLETIFGKPPTKIHFKVIVLPQPADTTQYEVFN